MIRSTWIGIAVLGVIFWLSGCVPLTTTAPTPSRTVPTLQTAIASRASATPTPYKMPATATFTPFPTATRQPPTPTPQPTLTAEEMRALILELLKNNGGCRLPCLWGLVPGKTNIQTLDRFLAQFHDVETPEDYFRIQDFGDIGGFSLVFNENKDYILVDFSYYEDANGIAMLTMFGYLMREFGTTPEGALDLRPIYGDALFRQTFQYYTLPNILSTYGLPERVLLATWPDDPERPDIKSQPFSLVLLYPSQGIFIEYVTLRQTKPGYFVSCPDTAHIYLGVWSPERALPLTRIVQAGSVINRLNIDYFKPLEEATSLSLEEFYRTFKDPNNTTCLQTPIELWKP